MSQPKTPSLTYKDAGVDIDAGEALVDRIKPAVKATRRAGADADLGGFGGLFDLKAIGYNDPILVAGTDGVGTKLEVAKLVGDHSTIGIDLVAMVVNDLVVQGAEPLFFLDYFATGKLDVEEATQVIQGIARGCKESGCALIGGETAEMPGLYKAGDYDLAGFAVGAVERENVLPASNIQAGDVLIGLPSSGVHSNGYSLVRHIIKQVGASYSDTPVGWSQTLGEALLAPTRLYISSCLPLAQKKQIKGMAHITGGGITENLPRVLPENLSAEIEVNAWERPAIFAWLQEQGNIAATEMLRTFNCGIGMILVVAAEKADAVQAALKAGGEISYRIGKLIPKAEAEVVYR